jgi:hypothetical protein
MFVFAEGKLSESDLTGFDVPGGGFLPFASRELLERLD